MDLEVLTVLETKHKDTIKKVEEQILNATKVFQIQLKDEKAKLKDIKKQIKAINKTSMKDKNTHILDRFDLWLNSKDKEKLDWILEEGPLIETLFDDEHRYETIEVQYRLEDFMQECGYYIDGMDDDFGIDISIENGKPDFAKLDKNGQDKITAILEDAIKQNASEFKYDW